MDLRLPILAALALNSLSASALMPLPARMSKGEGRLKIDGGFSVRFANYSDQRLKDAAGRFVLQISRQTGIPLAAGAAPILTISCSAAAEVPKLGEDESYDLDIKPDGATLTAPTVIGAMRGMQTFSQLVSLDATSFYVPVVHIQDHPRFPWRGLMLDVARHWMPLPVIERNLDAMAAVKFNVFHWHLSDDQGFRVESKLYPKLQQSGSDGKFYTQAEIRHVVDYARARGIRVVPEFDIPGHTTSWLAGYPELGSAAGPFEIERNWGIFEPVLDPSREDVYTFLDGLFGEMANLFPDEYFHIGGDEVLDAEWLKNPAIQEFAKKKGFQDSAQVHAYFNQRLQALLAKHGKKMIGWDEVLNPALSNDLIIQSWRGQKSLADAARKGFRGILSYGYYLDHLKPASALYQVDPQSSDAKELDSAQAALILGGEACMWTEYVTEETVDSRIWPRAAVVAERLWSPATESNLDSMYDRLAVVSRWLDWSGVQHRANYPLMLERLAGGNPAPALKVLADAVEAQGIGDRQAARKYRSTVPLNRLVDAARPESESVRSLVEGMSRLLADPARHKTEASEIRVAFQQWSINNEQLRPILTNNILLQEAAPLSEELSRLGSIGLHALQFLESGKRVSPDWLKEQKKALDQMEQPKAEVVLAAVRPVRALLDAISPPSQRIRAKRTQAESSPGSN